MQLEHADGRDAAGSIVQWLRRQAVGHPICGCRKYDHTRSARLEEEEELINTLGCLVLSGMK
jgi:hypothetical protein